MSTTPPNPPSLNRAPSSSSSAPRRSLPTVPPQDGDEEDVESSPPPPPVPTRPPVPRFHLNPATNILPSSTSSLELTPLRAHYLKKTLINLEIYRELSALSDPKLGSSSLGLLGPPFVALTSDGKKKLDQPRKVTESREDGGNDDLPFLRFMFHQFLLPFPFLMSAPPSFWSAKVQPFLTSFLSITSRPTVAITANSPTGADYDETTATEEDAREQADRKKLWDKVEKNLGVLMSLGIKLVGGEEVVRISQMELRKLEDEAEERRRKWKEREERVGGGFEVNVVSVRLVTEKGRVRSKSHDVSEYWKKKRKTLIGFKS